MSERIPDCWKTYTGPSGWYRLGFPPTWSLAEDDGIVRLMSRDEHAMLTINSFWAPEPDSLDAHASIGVEELFPRRRNVRPLPSLDLPYDSVGLQGETILERKPKWWRRVVTRCRWRRWRIWSIRHGSVGLIATFLQTGDVDPELETLAVMVLTTLEISDEPADPPEVFAERVLQLARRKFPLLDCRPVENFQLKLGESNINLFNFYRSYVNSPESFDEIMLPALATVVQVQEWGDGQTEPDLDHVRDRIMPMLYPESVWRESFPTFVGVSWIADLMILYVVDESQAYWYIRNDLLERWQLTQPELHRLAMDNLRRYFEERSMEFTLVGEEDGPRLLMPTRPDAYNTARLLNGEFQQKLRELLGAQFAVGIPNRDFFVAVSLDSDQTLQQVRSKVAEDFAHMDHPLSDRLLLVSADGVSEFC